MNIGQRMLEALWLCDYTFKHADDPSEALDAIGIVLGRVHDIIHSASGMEAATAGETVQQGSTEGDSPVPKADAQRPPQ